MAAQTPTRAPLTLFDSARIVGGKMAEVHHNACPALQTERPEDCCCAEAEYRLVPAGGAKR
jgi:hypothetical protein